MVVEMNNFEVIRIVVLKEHTYGIEREIDKEWKEKELLLEGQY